jgi:hypothetical protein
MSYPNKNNLIVCTSGQSFGVGLWRQTTQMVEIEPLLVELCCHLNCMAKSIGKDEFLALANDIIVGTPTSEQMRLFHKTNCGNTKENNWLGTKYFYNFMNQQDGMQEQKQQYIQTYTNP